MGDVEKPSPKDNEVLIKIHAATVLAGDCELRRFQLPILFWLPVRIIMGIRKPRKGRKLGQELAGEIELVGKDVMLLKQGDRVFGCTGMHMGAYADYVCLPDTHPMAMLPSNLTFEEAAGVPVGGINALHFLRKARIQRGEKVLIYGSTGSIGTFAVQLARYFGAEVTAVCSATNSELVKSLGAAKELDYTANDFAKSGETYDGETYDVIFDTIGKSSFSRCRRSLNNNGRYLLGNPRLPQMIRGLWLSMISGKKVIFSLARERTEDLNFLKELIEAGEIKPVIDRRYRLEQVAEAHTYVEKGQKTGNVVISIV